jgi:hypothetical protein
MRSVPASTNRSGEVTLTVPGQYTLLGYQTKRSGLLGKESTVILLRPVEWKDPNLLAERGRVEQRGRG